MLNFRDSRHRSGNRLCNGPVLVHQRDQLLRACHKLTNLLHPGSLSISKSPDLLKGNQQELAPSACVGFQGTEIDQHTITRSGSRQMVCFLEERRTVRRPNGHLVIWLPHTLLHP